jgi:hypothetical protein
MDAAGVDGVAEEVADTMKMDALAAGHLHHCTDTLEEMVMTWQNWAEVQLLEVVDNAYTYLVEIQAENYHHAAAAADVAAAYEKGETVVVYVEEDEADVVAQGGALIDFAALLVAYAKLLLPPHALNHHQTLSHYHDFVLLFARAAQHYLLYLGHHFASSYCY